MLMRGRGSRAKRAKKKFPGPSWGPGKVTSWLFGCDEQCELFHAVYSQFDKIILLSRLSQQYTSFTTKIVSLSMVSKFRNDKVQSTLNGLGPHHTCHLLSGINICRSSSWWTSTVLAAAGPGTHVVDSRLPVASHARTNGYGSNFSSGNPFSFKNIVLEIIDLTWRRLRLSHTVLFIIEKPRSHSVLFPGSISAAANSLLSFNSG